MKKTLLLPDVNVWVALSFAVTFTTREHRIALADLYSGQYVLAERLD